MSRILFDYGKIFVSHADYESCEPRSVDDAVADVRRAARDGKAVRIRGSGHSLSGMTLPRAGEQLIRTGGLDHFRVDAPGTITVGGGAILWDIRDFVAAHGWQLPVYNGGWAGPSVGGYISAGGMGLRVPPTERGRATIPGATAPRSISELHGGFWEHVRAVKLLDGEGRLHRIGEDDPRFPWLFASSGQFGLIVEAVLGLLPGAGAAAGLQPGACGRIPRLHHRDPAETDGAPAGDAAWLYWFSLMVSPAEEPQAWDALGSWLDRHDGIVAPSGGWVGPVRHGQPTGFRYLVRHRRFTPPLLYPRDEDFVLMGIMAACRGVGGEAGAAALVRAERDFVAVSLARSFSLYVQAENLSRSLDFESYYGPARAGHFRALKREFDPAGRINPGEIFADGTPPPRQAASARRLARAMERVLATKET